MKRSFSVFLALIIGWGSVTQPARAFAPPLIYAAYMTASTGGGTYTIAALAGAIGVAGMYLTIKDAQDNAVRIPVGPSPSQQPPAPVAAPTATAQTSSSYCVYGTPHCGSSPSEICQKWGEGFGQQCYPGQYGATTYVGSGGDYNMGYCLHSWPCGSAARGEINRSGDTVQCPSGYSASAGSCVLQNARRATDDKTCDILLTNGQFATADDMNCPSTVDGTKLAPMIREGKVIAYGTNSSGQPLMWEVSQTGGSIQIKEHTQIQTPTQTQVKTTTVSVDAATSAVTQVQTQTSPGSLSSPSANSVPQTTTDPATQTDTPTVQKDQTKPADLQTCGLPGAPACSVNDDGFEGKDNFSGPKSQEISDKLEQNKTQLENIKNSVPDIAANWIPSLMPGAASACSPLTFDFSVNNQVLGMLSAPNVKLDICEHLDLVRSILGYMLGLYTVWYVWRRFTTANQGA